MEHALPRRTAGAPRSWSLLLTSENHGAVGPLGSTFPHAGEKHERVQVVEIVAAGSPPAPGVDLSGLLRFDFSDLDGENEQFGEITNGAYFLAHQVEARCASAALVAAQAGQVAVPGWIDIDATEPPEHELIALRYWPYGNSENPQAVTGGRYIDGTYYNDEGDEMHPPSHWCRLPYFDAEATAKASTSGERQEGGQS